MFKSPDTGVKSFTKPLKAALCGLLLFIGVGLAFTPTKSSQAAVNFNQSVNFQGRLTDASGNVVPDGTYNVEFKLWTAATAGTNVWTETRLVSNTQGVTVSRGLFSVQLGSVASLAGFDWNRDLYLGVNIGDTVNTATPTYDGEMTPRHRLGQAPTAAFAGLADNANNLGGVASGNYARLDTGNTFAGNTQLFKNGTNSVTAFKIQNSAGTSNLFNADTTNSRIGIGTAAPAETLDVNGDIRSTYSHTHGLTRTVPTVVGDEVDLGDINTGIGAATFYITASVNTSAFSNAKAYVVPIAYSLGANTWQILQPISDSGPYSGPGGADFALDIKVNANVASLRLRRTVATNVGTAQILIRQEGGNADGFTPSTATSSVTAPTTTFSTTTITQQYGKTGIGLQPSTTGATFQVAGGIQASQTSLAAASAALNGTLVYDSTAGKFKVYEGGAIKTLCNTTDLGCGAAGGSTDLQTAYNNSTSPATIVTTSVAKGILFKAGTGFDSTSLFQIQAADASSVLSVDTVNSRIGIGTATPGAKLEVKSSGGNNPSLLLNTSSTTDRRVSVGFAQNGAINWEFGTDSGANNQTDLYFYSRQGATFGITQKADGSVGIGTQSPGTKLDVVGTIRGSGGVYGGNFVDAYNPGGYGALVAEGTGDGYNYAGLQLKSRQYNTAWLNTYAVAYNKMYWAFQNGSISSNEMSLDTNGNLRIAGGYTGGAAPDIAETIPAADNVTPADVVSADPNQSEHAIRSTRPYDSTTLGIISDGSSTFKINAHGNDPSAADTGKYLVLAGRVPVHVTDEGGTIRPGDYLTSSSTPGYAMKANHAGPTIGKALAPFAGTTGTVMTQTNLSYYNPASGDNIQGSNADFATVNVSGTATIQNLVVKDKIETQTLVVNGDATIKGNADVQGNLKVGKDLELGADSKGVNVAIDQGFSSKMVTFATPRTDTNYAVQVTPGWDTNAWVTEKTATGFKVNFKAAPAGATLDWVMTR